ncbi:hypothetical protein HU675_0020300 [Bradyrhizobium septentrionale]|nr:hypothetical protein [Bradyrhizobium septentrionale]UGY28920.1 hypothetical protein HU675_0020300 [Bradyrhizobium septentrionale]
MREVIRLRKKSYLDEKAVQQRGDLKIVRVLRTQRRQLLTHLNEVQNFSV